MAEPADTHQARASAPALAHPSRLGVATAAMIGMVTPWLAYAWAVGSFHLLAVLLFTLGAFGVILALALAVAFLVGVPMILYRIARRMLPQRATVVLVLAPLTPLGYLPLLLRLEAEPLLAGACLSMAGAVLCAWAAAVRRESLLWVPYSLVAAALVVLLVL